MFQFYWPWFALLLPLPMIVRFLFPSKKERTTEAPPRLLFPQLVRLKKAFPTAQAITKKSKFSTLFLLSLLWICLITTLMQPELVDQYTNVKNEGHDLMLAVDISLSMKAVDMSTKSSVLDRLDVTKDVVNKFLKGRQGDRVGLIIFGGHAFLHVPFTLDVTSVGKLLNDTLPGMAGQGTAIGDAIGLAVRNLRERPEGSRVLILLTDGEDNSSSIPPYEATKLAKQYGIRIYTIGVGNPNAAPYPTQFGGYQIVQMPLDEKLLKAIAEATGGQYFHAAD
ncbi:MAG: VWA domain-containing protein [Chlamydiota bacterium]